MGQGQDKVARNLVDLQPTAIVELFLLYLDTVDKETAFIALHGGSIFANPITWQGVEYLPIPIETEGFEILANGELPRPKIRISNKDYFITDLLNRHQDLQFAKVIRKRTFVKFLDNVNFDGGNPWGEADSSAEISNDTYLIGQKTAENKLFVEFELTSPLDLENFEVNNRIILSRYCNWYYRGNGCNYKGPPVETEEGDPIYMSAESAANWASVRANAEWRTGKFYGVGDPAFLTNKKITLNDGDYPKIWYVCKSGHTSEDLKRPDLNTNYWQKDGCNKKLHACKKRFQDENTQELYAADGSFQNNYVNFTYINNTTVSNNIAPLSTVTQSSVLSNNAIYSGTKVIDNIIGGSPTNITNLLTNTADNKWVANDTKGTLTLTWGSAQTIDQINIWDAEATQNINNAVVTFFNGATQIDQLRLDSVPTDGKTPGILSFATKTVTSIRISGSGNVGNTAISEVQVLDSSPNVGLVFDNSTDFIHRDTDLHIGMWLRFTNGKRTNTRYEILHNIQKNPNVNTNYLPSGLSLYALNNDLVLEFPVSYVLKNGTSYTDAFETKEVRLTNFPFATSTPLHIQIYKGKSNGLNPTAANIDKAGYIQMSTLNDISSKYTLPTEAPVKSAAGATLTEKSNKPSYFKFGNPNYQGGMSSNLFIGLRNYDYHGEELTSNVQLGTVAIWKEIKNQTVINWFNRNDKTSQLYNGSLVGKYPRAYSEFVNTDIRSDIEKNLFAWWAMNLSNTSPYRVQSSNSPIKTLSLTGTYSSAIDSSATRRFSNVITITQTPQTSLPFGGFPGTDRYGR